MTRAAGNMTSGPAPGDEGDADKRQFYTWDAWNRLVKVVEDTDGDGTEESTDKTLAEYRYDGLNRRIRIFTDPPESGYDWAVREVYLRLCLTNRSGVGRLHSPLAASACIDDSETNRLLRPPCQGRTRAPSGRRPIHQTKPSRGWQALEVRKGAESRETGEPDVARLGRPEGFWGYRARTPPWR
jgi:hypothetical protein